MYHSVHFLEEVADIDYCYYLMGTFHKFLCIAKFTHRVLIVTSTIFIGL